MYDRRHAHLFYGYLGYAISRPPEPLGLICNGRHVSRTRTPGTCIKHINLYQLAISQG